MEFSIFELKGVGRPIAELLHGDKVIAPARRAGAIQAADDQKFAPSSTP